MSTRVTDAPARRPTRDVRWVIAGLIAITVAWLLIIPPFGGTDEFDHAYRASAVAHGQVVAPPSQATRGTGAVVFASRDVVAAARDHCLALGYTTVRDCTGDQLSAGDLVAIPSGAGRYCPVYYLLTGWLGRILPGTPGLLAQRALSLVLCALVLALGMRLIRAWPDPAAGLRGLVLAASPVLVYSLAVLAPNGLEMAAGVTWWIALLTVCWVPAPPRLAWFALVGSGVLLATLRGLGPLWLLASLSVVVVWLIAARRLPLRGAAALLRHPRALPRPPAPLLVCVGVLAAALLAGTAWTLIQGTLVVGRERNATGASLLSGLQHALISAPLRPMELISDVPPRAAATQPLPVAAWVLAVGLLAIPALRAATRQARWSWALLLAAVAIIPFAIEVATFRSFGGAWQARYVFPLAVGVPLILGFLGQPAGRAPARVKIDTFVTAAAVAVAHLTLLVAVPRGWLGRSPAYVNGSWPLIPEAAVLAVAVLGCVSIAVGLLRAVAEPPATTVTPPALQPSTSRDKG